MGYRGAFEQNYVKAVIEPFMKAHPDISVVYAGVQNAAAALGNLRAQRAHRRPMPSSSTCRSLRSPAMRGCWPSWTCPHSRLWRSGGSGQDLGAAAIPLTYDTLTLIYDRDAFVEAPTSWNAFWDPKQRGKVTIPAQGGGDIQAILLTIIANRMAGGATTRKRSSPAWTSWSSSRPRCRPGSPSPTPTLVANGTSTLSIGCNARSQYYYDQTEGRLRSISPKGLGLADQRDRRDRQCG